MYPNVNVDLIGQGGGNGVMANYMAQSGRMDPSVLRPWVGKDGRTYIAVHQGGDPTDMANHPEKG